MSGSMRVLIETVLTIYDDLPLEQSRFYENAGRA